MITTLYGLQTAGPMVLELAVGRVGLLSSASSETSTNEDAALVCERDGSLLLAVADGMGGMPGGDRAARTVVESLGEHYLAGVRVEDAIELANDAVRSLRGPACTLVVGTLAEGQLHTFHVGDAQACVIGGRGAIKGVTMPHSVVGHATQAGMIDEQEATDHPDRHIVTNAVGEAVLRVERTRWRAMRPKDTLILASDGLFDALDLESIAARAPRGSLDSAMATLLADSRAAPAVPDDLTLIAFRPT